MEPTRVGVSVSFESHWVPAILRTLLHVHRLGRSNSSPALRWGLLWRGKDARYRLQAVFIVNAPIRERDARFPAIISHMRDSIFVVAHTVLERRHRRTDSRGFRVSFVAP